MYEKLWVHDQVHHDMNQICSQKSVHEVYISMFNALDEELMSRMGQRLVDWAPGLQLVSIRLTKPEIPERLRQNYELVDEKKTNLLIAMQRQQTIIKEAQTEKQAAIWQAEKQLTVALIDFQKKEQAQQGRIRISHLEDEMIMRRSMEETDSWFYRAMKDVAAMREKLSPQYLKWLRFQSFSNKLTLYYGNSIPAKIVKQQWRTNRRK